MAVRPASFSRATCRFRIDRGACSTSRPSASATSEITSADPGSQSGRHIVSGQGRSTPLGKPRCCPVTVRPVSGTFSIPVIRWKSGIGSPAASTGPQRPAGILLPMSLPALSGAQMAMVSVPAGRSASMVQPDSSPPSTTIEAPVT